MKYLQALEKSPKFWLFLSAFMLMPVLIAHFFFQNYLFMRPCEQCVYIRFDFIIIAFFCLLLTLPFKISKFIGFLGGFFGIFSGLKHALLLAQIYKAISKADPFSALPGCKNLPEFYLNLPLHELIPALFLPTGDCGIDRPFVSNASNLSKIQEFFIGTPPNFSDGLYSNGWFLMPSLELINMAQACAIIFSIVLILFLALAFVKILPKALFKKF